MNDVEKQIYFSSWIDFTSTCMVQAAGGLLKYIEKGHLGLVLDDDTFCSVNSIAFLSLKHVLNIDDNTYKALQIFQGERHPSVYKSSFGSKEGLSLFGICNKCKSAIGKKELRRWFLLPTTEITVISEREAAVKYFSSSRNSEITSTLQSSLKQIKFVSRIFSRMKISQASMNDWQALYKIATTFSSDLFRIVNLLNKIIDFDEFAKQNHFTVKYGVDSELDQMKRRYHGLPDFMTQIACEELQNLDHDVQQCRVIYLPQLGYLLAVPMTEQMRETKDYTIQGLRFMFVVNDTVHYKSEKTRELDATLGDTLCDIYDKETQIMHKLQNVILEMKDLVFPVMDLCAKLDCLIALACAAKEYSWTEPEIVKDDTLHIIKGRHPLQEMCVAAFVANDTLSGGSESKIKVLTGPNSSGKSVYLKQVALIVYMAHIGSFVPASQAKIPIVSSIFAYTHSTESVSVNLSSFFISLNQISLPLNNATSNSVVVVDEFGKDTEHHSGLALVVAILKFWAEKGASAPHIFLATHYLSLNTFFTNSPFIKFQTMDIIQNEDLVFLYQIVDGIAVSSHAANTALLAGLPQHIVSRSLEISQALKNKQAIPPNKSLVVNQKLKIYHSIYEQFLELDVETDDVLDFIKFIKDSIASLTTPNVNT
ncbi:mutS protein homolog 5-like isoform X2 [Uloborus diversus]|uniref:mutS protein homolog 5-like isoform X2 n=1 Tax=Uloborus diversus TaxID=327109 RepID=UPI002408FAD6|nr:mutS protein homolog 5-like isoform X2 [Uloborus diversus]